MIGGGGERRTLLLVARYADACNLFAGPGVGPEQVRAKLDVLARHCADEGRNFDRIRKTVLWGGPVGVDATGAAEFLEALRPYADLGIEAVHVMPMTPDPVAFVRGLGERVVPHLPATG